MRKYFVDTWYLLAYFDEIDSHHHQARRIKALIERAELISHDGVLTEFLAAVSRGNEAARGGAVMWVRGIMARATVIESNRELFLRALDFYGNRLDKHYSLVDCMSMLVMRDLGITHVLTNDHHFRQEGFTVVNE